ncbi:prohibitin family protein [Candidatus Peregrinibacteria bacterium]|nr:prohibitin family protein [Candidatus Peregrinibacteria bacterium]
MSPFQLNVKVVVGIVATLLVIFIIIDGLVSVPIGHVAVIYDRTRGVLKEELPEGLHLKIPFWQVATIVDTRLQEYTMSIATEEGRIRGDDSIEALTKDGQTVWIDATVRYRIQPDKASDILHEIGSDYDGIIIRPEVRSIIREIITGYESKQLFLLESRQEAAKEMQEKLQARYALHDIILDTLLLRNVQFSEVYLNAIEEKQVAEQKIQKAEFERQEAEIQKKTKIIEAEGESESIRLKGEALSKSPEVIQLEFVQKMAPQINWGILPDGAIPLLDVGKLQN